MDAPRPSTCYGPAADCWAFGVTALELLTGLCLFTVDPSARPADLVPGTNTCADWDVRHIADLHAEWVRQS